MGAKNALELIRLGQLSPREGAPYAVVHRTGHYRLRHYEAARAPTGSALLLVPPLMLTAEIYDVSADLSAARMLTAEGIDTWVVDFGAPEREEGGMQRTLDDHVRSVIDAIRKVRALTGRPVHVAGYSQGGMFCYQAAAYLRSEGVASIITFGSPVDIHRNLPNVRTDVAARLIRAARPFAEPPLRLIDGLPGFFTSTGFRMFSFRREVQQVAEFLALLHDRRALEKREHRRRFLSGEGFVAWPGPALMKFIDEFIVHNRLVSGGFVIDGRTVTLADIRSPILCFVGGRDEIARPASVRAIRDAAPAAELFEATIPSGHFGLVVGTVANHDSWPTVVEWIEWRNGEGALPRLLAHREVVDEGLDEDAAFDSEFDVELVSDVALRMVQSAWKWIGDLAEDLGDATDQIRYQLPRLSRLRRIRPETRLSLGRELARRGAKHGDSTFFLYEGRAVTYADANRRIDNVVRGLISCGVRPGNLVGVVMRPRPSHLSMVTALSRLGAVSVLIKPTDDLEMLRRAVSLGQLQFLVADPDNATIARAAFGGSVLVLGSGRENELPPDVVDMESIDPERIELPAWYRPDPGYAEDLSMIFVTVGKGGSRAVRITNRRWAFSAVGAAAACTLTPNDTVYCCLPLNHPTGLLVAAGAATASGARLSLATRFEPTVFWDEVRRYGATVAFYAGDMCRALVDAPPAPGERTHPLRLFAGSGMRGGVWRRLRERFGAGILEFYASTEVSFVLANALGEKVGSVGRPLPGSRESLLAAFDMVRGDFVRDRRGRMVAARPDQPGVLLVKVEPTPRAPLDDGAAISIQRTSVIPRVVRGALADDDAWFVTGDLFRKDADGDYWILDRLEDLVRTDTGLVPSRRIEDAIDELPGVRRCAAYGAIVDSGKDGLCIAVALKAGATLDPNAIRDQLLRAGVEVTPTAIRFVEDLPMTDGYRVVKDVLRKEGIHRSSFLYDPGSNTYGSIDLRNQPRSPGSAE